MSSAWLNQAALCRPAPPGRTGSAAGLRSCQYAGAIVQSSPIRAVCGTTAGGGALHRLAPLPAGMAMLLPLVTAADRGLRRMR